MLSLLAILLVFSTANGFDSYIPQQKELIYNYEANLSVGTNQPKPYFYTFVLKGKLSLHTNESNSIKVQLSNLTYALRNKPSNDEKFLQLPSSEQLRKLEEPFKIMYDPNGSGVVYGIETYASEKEYTRNIKKAIASILQLAEELGKVDSNRVITANEQSLYGEQAVNYNVTLDNDKLQVTKTNQETRTSDRLYRYFETSFEALSACDIPPERPLKDKVERKYVIAARNNEKVVEFISSEGTIFHNPFDGKSDSKVIEVTQKFELFKIDETKPRPVKNSSTPENLYSSDIFYQLFDEGVELEDHPDITHGRTVVDFDKLFETVNEILENIVKHYEGDNLSMETPDNLDVNKLRGILRYFDVKKLEKLHQLLLKKPQFLEIFYEILPIIGSRASVLMIRNLVISKTVSEDVATSLLETFPEPIVIPSRKLVEELEGLIYLNSTYSWRIKNVAILSFGALVHRSYNYEKKKARISAMRLKLSEGRFQPKTPPSPVLDYESYVIEYINKIRTVKNLKVRLAYIDGLHNMKMASAVKLIKPGLDGEWWNCHHSKHHALWSVLSALALEGFQSVYDFYSQFLMNREEHIEFRIASYYFIMESKPSLQILDNITQFMKNEPDEEIYKFHYMYVKSFKDSANICDKNFNDKLKEIFKSMREPTKGLSFGHIFDYSDSKYGFGAGVSILAPNTNDSNYFMFTLRNQLGYTPFKTDVFVKLFGVREPNVDYTAATIQQFILQRGKKNMFLEVTVLQHNRFLNSYSFNQENIDWQAIIDIILGKKLLNFKKEWLKINDLRYDRMLIPTDLGMPAIWDYSVPLTTKYDFDVNLDLNNLVAPTLNFRFFVSNWISHRNGFAVYNPILDIRQGIHRYNTLVTVLPIQFDLRFTSIKNILKINSINGGNQSVMGLASHTASRVFLQDDFKKKIYLESCPSCKEWEFVTMDRREKNIKTLMRGEALSIGRQLQAMVYDDDNRITNDTLRNLLKHIQESSNKNFETYVDQFFLNLIHLWNFLSQSPLPGSYGFLIRIEPVKEVENIELMVTSSDLKSPINLEILQSSTRSVDFIYNIKGINKTLQTWKLSVIFNTEPTEENYKIHVTRIDKDLNEIKFSINKTDKWMQDGISGNIGLVFGQCKKGECTKDSIIDIETSGGRSNDQTLSSLETCRFSAPLMSCLATYNSMQNFSYNVKYKNVSKEVEQIFETFEDQLRDVFSYSYHEYLVDNDIGENKFKINIIFKPDQEKKDINVLTPQRRYEIINAPKDPSWERIPKLEYIMPHVKTTYMLYYKNQLDYCFVNSKDLSNDWTMYYGDLPVLPQHAIYLKKPRWGKSPKIELKVVYGSQQFFNVPVSSRFLNQIASKTIEKDWMYHEASLDTPEKMFAILPHLGIYFDLNGDEFILAVPKAILNRFGRCFVHVPTKILPFSLI